MENTRVGQITDLDKLLITIDTDGSITPREAFEEARGDAWAVKLEPTLGRRGRLQALQQGARRLTPAG